MIIFLFNFRNDLDLPDTHLNSKIASQMKITHKENKNVQMTTLRSEDIGRIVILSPKIRQWKKKSIKKGFSMILPH